MSAHVCNFSHLFALYRTWCERPFNQLDICWHVNKGPNLSKSAYSLRQYHVVVFGAAHYDTWYWFQFAAGLWRCHKYGSWTVFTGRFAHLLHKFWSGQVSLLHPADFKKTIGKYHPQFRDYRQVSQWLIGGCYILPVLCMTLCVNIMAPVGQNQRWRYVSWSLPGSSISVHDCLVVICDIHTSRLFTCVWWQQVWHNDWAQARAVGGGIYSCADFDSLPTLI